LPLEILGPGPHCDDDHTVEDRDNRERSCGVHDHVDPAEDDREVGPDRQGGTPVPTEGPRVEQVWDIVDKHDAANKNGCHVGSVRGAQALGSQWKADCYKAVYGHAHDEEDTIQGQ